MGNTGSTDGGANTPNNTAPPPAANPTIDALSSHAGDDDLPIQMGKGELFDPNILERIAQAARELSKSPHAKDVIQLAKDQELSWQHKYAAATAESNIKLKDKEKEVVQVQEEQRRRTAEFETQQRQQRAQHEDQLQRKRYEDQLRAQAQMNDHERQKQEQSVARQEGEKRRSMEYQEQLRQKTEMMKVRAQTEAAAKQERENKDIRMEQLKMQSEELRTTVIEGIKTAGSTIGQGITDYLQDKQKMAATVGVITAIAAGVYGARQAAAATGKYVMTRMGKPPLVRETSKRSPLLHPVKTIKSALSKPKGNPLDGIVLEEELQTRLRDITVATAHTRRHGGIYRNVLLYGAPGTGKTLFATRLAHQSGLDYAILAGGDVGPLGKDAVTEIHNVFDWAQSSRKGLLLFVDEADAFLRKRGEFGDGRMSEDLRNALSTFLYRTGTPSDKVMLVFASNEPAAFDRAIADRVDEAVEFSLPKLPERVDLLNQYFTEHVINGSGTSAKKIQIAEEIDVTNWEPLAKQLEGFSGRAIAKLCMAWQGSAYASVDNKLTKEMLDRVVTSHIDQMNQKNAWEATKLS